MPKVGDRVTVEIRGAPIGGTAVTTGFSIEPGAQIRVQGKIVEDHGAYWLVELAISVGGKNRLLVPKSAQKEA
jgi:hypothetical protein